MTTWWVTPAQGVTRLVQGGFFCQPPGRGRNRNGMVEEEEEPVAREEQGWRLWWADTPLFWPPCSYPVINLGEASPAPAGDLPADGGG